MIASRHLTKIIIVLMAFCACLCLCAVVFSSGIKSAAGDNGLSMDYETKLFDHDEILDINIIMDESSWQTMLDQATSEEYYPCDVEIAGKTYYNVAIRPKGNSSLTTIYMDSDTERYSLKLEFDRYVEGQTCYGLDKLILNNNYCDYTNMKEALVYDMYQYLGADASLYNYAKISVNGEYWGVYLALEAVEDSFLMRNYGVENGKLYKPDSMDLGGNGGFGGFSMGGGGSNLNYTDDDLDSYSTIWEGEVLSSGKSDHKKVVKALKNISEGNDLEQYMDIDNLLKYMAVHIFSVNEDSLSGNMAHNYYLYESGGLLNILPWDYNLAFGGMEMGQGSTTDMVNSAVDNAWNSTNFFDTLLENEKYHALYYEYTQRLVEEYLLGGGFEAFYTRTRSQIDTLVQTDPTAFCTYEEYLTAADTFCEVLSLRGASIQGQLDGTIPSTQEEQQGSDTLIDASYLSLSDMGSMGRDGGFGKEKDFGGGRGFDGSRTDEMPKDFEPSQMGGKPDMNFAGEASGTSKAGTLILYGLSAVIMLTAFLFVIFYRRKSGMRYRQKKKI